MKIFTVTQINNIIKNIIDNEIVLEDIVVTGELSSFSVARGIAYFTLKDNETILSCVQFGCKQEFNIGDMVECKGNIKYYPKGGKLSLNVLSIQFSGQGELYKRFIELIGCDCKVMQVKTKELFELKYSKTANLYSVYKLYNFIITEVEDLKTILNPQNLKCEMFDLDNLDNTKLVSNAIWFCEQSINELKENAIHYDTQS